MYPKSPKCNIIWNNIGWDYLTYIFVKGMGQTGPNFRKKSQSAA